MQRASAVSVWGAVFVALVFIALVFSRSGPVEAQTDPLADQTANITSNKIGPIAVAGCEADQGATVSVTIANADEEETFTDGTNAEFRFGQQGITITGQNGSDLTLQDLRANTEGTVVSSTGITCDDDGTGTNGNNRADTDTPSEDQYESNDVIRKTVPDKPLPKTGGASLILGAGVLLAVAAILSIRVLRP